jgi:bifunctional enzyme CysN/CysC
MKKIHLTISDQFRCRIDWSSPHPMYPGRYYKLELDNHHANATITSLRHRLDPHTGNAIAAAFLTKGQSGLCNMSLGHAIPFTPYEDDALHGSFSLFDRQTGEQVASGAIQHSLRRASNLHFQSFGIDRTARAEQKRQHPVLLWFTGLSGAGKTTVANELEQLLFAKGLHTYLLDGDNLRYGLNRDLGFTDTDRIENIRRVTEVARLMLDAGLIVLASFISPFRADREQARKLVGAEFFIEIYVDVSLIIAEQRDVKGLYKKARSGQLKNFTGIDSPYEVPERPELHLRTDQETPYESAQRVMTMLSERGII